MDNQIQKLPPFIKFCYTIGMIPTSYKLSWTYEEQLIWFCDFLENTVIPTINNNGKAVEELQTLFLQLKQYVDDYFENLDVQEEINNKLDDMAESGELADMIAQYLQLAGLLVYDTKADLKAAENIVNGSTAMTLGETTYNDGHMNYYKIREIINTDVIDDNNILSLSASETLIAERIDVGTKLNLVSTLPLSKENNAEYEVTNYEETSSMTSIPHSDYEYVYNAKQEQARNEPNNIIKIGTWNIENSDTPYTGGIKNINKYETVRKVCDRLGCQAIALNEVHDGLLYKASELYLTDFYKYFNMVITWEDIKPLLNFGEGVLSSLEPTSTSSGLYTETVTEKQGYEKIVISYNNKTISIYSTHFSYNGGNEARQAQIDELYDVVAADTSTYKIIAGDFNFDIEEYGSTLLAEFLTAGYKLVNGGQYVTRTLPIDEIMVSSNIDILDSGILTFDDIQNVSDHKPLWGKLELK